MPVPARWIPPIYFHPQTLSGLKNVCGHDSEEGTGAHPASFQRATDGQEWPLPTYTRRYKVIHFTLSFFLSCIFICLCVCLLVWFSRWLFFMIFLFRMQWIFYYFRSFVEENFETDVDLEACDPTDWKENPKVYCWSCLYCYFEIKYNKLYTYNYIYNIKKKSFKNRPGIIFGRQGYGMGVGIRTLVILFKF